MGRKPSETKAAINPLPRQLGLQFARFLLRHLVLQCYMELQWPQILLLHNAVQLLCQFGMNGHHTGAFNLQRRSPTQIHYTSNLRFNRWCSGSDGFKACVNFPFCRGRQSVK